MVFTAQRVAYGLLTTFAVTVLVFAATQALPGDPASAILGNSATPERVAALRNQLGLDRPLVEQYFSWLGNLFHGDFGNSLLGGKEPVTKVISGPLFNSLTLVLLAGGIVVALSILLGAYAGARRDSAVDVGVLGASVALTAIPEFVVGLILVGVFATSILHVLPAVSVIAAGESPFHKPEQLILPVATLVLAGFPYLTRLTRGSVIEVFESEYVRMARLKGVPASAIVRRHVLPNALVPTIQGATMTLAYLTGGTVVVEYLFNYPGLGRTLSDAVSNRNLPVIQAVTLLFALAYVVLNLIGDVVTIYVSPRLRTEQL
ncbi:ABC transporter permease [Nocardia sp. NPDC059239]|uniref:ABC transporter permease n=1 Tax=unclassified Nocardia TaxID=2637762 RepID=UPI0036AA1FCD